MKYSKEQIDRLRAQVEKRLSQKRFVHTLGVEKMALLIGEKCLPERLDELSAAALLHDISKEYSEAEHFLVAKRHNITMTEAEKNESALWHSLTAAAVVTEDFPEYVEPDILSAVYNHTVGSPDMSVFDEIILLADYIEEGRKYEHLRWCAYMHARGYSYGEKRDDLALLNHNLVKYEDLETL